MSVGHRCLTGAQDGNHPREPGQGPAVDFLQLGGKSAPQRVGTLVVSGKAALFMLDAQIDNRPLYFERALAHDDQDVKIRVAAVISPHA